MPTSIEDMIGQTFGKLKVLRYVRTSKKNGRIAATLSPLLRYNERLKGELRND